MRAHGIRLAAVLLSPLLLPGAVPGSAAPARAQVGIYVHNAAEVSPRILERMREVAGGIFDAAGVEVVWLDGVNAETPETPEVAVRILPRSRVRDANVFGIALTAAGPGFATLADVFFDQIDSLAARQRSTSEGVLHVQSMETIAALTMGVVLTHEVAHLLLGGADAHTRDGIMGRFINRQHLEQALAGVLRFDAAQSRRLRNELTARLLAEEGFPEESAGGGALACDFDAVER